MRKVCLAQQIDPTGLSNQSTQCVTTHHLPIICSKDELLTHQQQALQRYLLPMRIGRCTVHGPLACTGQTSLRSEPQTRCLMPNSPTFLRIHNLPITTVNGRLVSKIKHQNNTCIANGAMALLLRSWQEATTDHDLTMFPCCYPLLAAVTQHVPSAL